MGESAEIVPLLVPDEAVTALDRRLDELELGLRNLSLAEGRRHKRAEERLERIEGKLDRLVAAMKRRKT